MTRLLVLLGHWSTPPDGVARAAVVLAALLFVIALSPGLRPRLVLFELPRAPVLIVCAFAAGFLSLGYVAYYLGGGPRIIDATMYFLQGRALSHGAFAWPLSEPSEAIRGRFLYAHDDHVGGIFPPGYPLLLSLGFRLGAPMVIGPFTAIALVFLTYALARSLALGRPEREGIARTAALLSVVCAALRYHTADTMAHGAAALEIGCALLAGIEGSRALDRDRTTSRILFAAAGVALGLLLATRPISAAGAAIAVLLLAVAASPSPAAELALVRWRERAGTLFAVALGALPGVLLLLASQRAVTGHFFASTQRAYYAASDGPPGCFRYGFGAGIGCLFEHRDFVRDRLPHGYTLAAAALTTLRRLHHHLRDVMSLELLAPLVVVPFVARRRISAGRGGSGGHHDTRRLAVRAAGVLLAVHVLAYAPFYFDGDYPGGGARFFADLLPVEHALAALGLALILPTFVSYSRAALAVVGLSVLAFAVHTVHDHRELAARDGGSPMFELNKVRTAGAEHGLVYFDTDHGFDLAYDPIYGAYPGSPSGPTRADDPADVDPDAPVPVNLHAARHRGDDGDRLVYDRAGHPPSFRYLFDPTAAPAEPKVESWTPARIGPREAWRFEAESSWPPLGQTDAWAEPVWIEGTSNGRALVAYGTGASTPGEIVVSLPVPATDTVWSVTPRILVRGIPGHAELIIGAAPDAVTWTWDDGPDATLGARDLAVQTIAAHGLAAFPVHLKVSGQVAWDRTMVRAR